MVTLASLNPMEVLPGTLVYSSKWGDGRVESVGWDEEGEAYFWIKLFRGGKACLKRGQCHVVLVREN